MRWILPIPADGATVDQLMRELQVPRWTAELLVRRGIAAPEAADTFLHPRLNALLDPFLIPQMDAAVARILAAVDRGERIVLYGDYDVDGVTSLALLTRVLREFGAKPECFLPLRADEGYGLSADGIARCVETLKPRLLIAVDCGTTSVAEIASLTAQGIDTIVIDHHEPASSLPPCVALVNPKLSTEFHYLCSVGLVFKLAHALLKRRPAPQFDLRDVLDLVALGTVADLVPLNGENRAIVRRGLLQLARSKWPGIRALIEVSGISVPFTPRDVGFGLGPRLNAAGRLGTAAEALELLLTDDETRARALAADLDAQNRDRRAVEEAVFAEAVAQIAEWFDPARDAAIVAGALGWHPGVVGIVASRLQKRHHRPALVIGFDGDGIGKGSGRSIEGLSLVAALSQCTHLLQKHGGHEMAAGFTVHHDRFVEFRDAFRSCARDLLTAEHLEPRLRVDAELSLAEIDNALLGDHEALEPFGSGNLQPVFCLRGVTLAAEPRIMKEKHYSFIFRQRGDDHRAVWFGGVEHGALPRQPWDVAFTVERNEWNGVVTAQMHVKAIRAAAAG